MLLQALAVFRQRWTGGSTPVSFLGGGGGGVRGGGIADGPFVGAAVGPSVGDSVGDFVGGAVGALVGLESCATTDSGTKQATIATATMRSSSIAAVADGAEYMNETEKEFC